MARSLSKSVVAGIPLAVETRAAMDTIICCLKRGDTVNALSRARGLRMEVDTRMVASQFCATLKEWLTAVQMAEVVRKNRLWTTHPDSCATHDFCDANEAMAEAFKRGTGRELDYESDEDRIVWMDAWDRCKEHDFNL